MIETWKDIKGFEGLYQISSLGRIKSMDRIYKGILSNHLGSYYAEKSYSGKILNQKLERNTKYFTVCLSKDGKRLYQYVHRLIAIAFVENPNNLPQVNHKDGNMKNNHVSNLEWVTKKENSSHASKMKLYRFGERHQNSKIVLNTETGIFYFSVREAAESSIYNRPYLTCMLSGVNKNKTHFLYV